MRPLTDNADWIDEIWPEHWATWLLTQKVKVGI